MLELIKDDPDSFVRHLKYFSSGVILDVNVFTSHLFLAHWSCKAIYGFKIESLNDPYAQIAEDGLKVGYGLVPGSFLVDAFPSCKFACHHFIYSDLLL
jgi:hypothetical protein